MKIPQLLKSPDGWIGLFCGMAALGIVLVLLSVLTGVKTLFYIGIGLGAPLLILALLLLFVVIPILIVMNRKYKK
jgi:hypothetical protein